MRVSSPLASGRQRQVTPVWAWFLQRGSGLLLGPLVLAHVSIPGAPWKVWLGVLLLLAVLTHAYTSLWRLTVTIDVSNATARAAVVATALLTLALAALGMGIMVAMIR